MVFNFALIKRMVILLLLIAYSNCYGQSIERSAIVSAASISSGSAELQSNVAELTVTSFFSSNLIATQGFIQNSSIIVTGFDHNSLGGNFRLYPNPTSGIINLQCNKNTKLPIEVDIYNVLGERQAGNCILNSVQNENSFSLDISNLSSGVYFIILRSIDGAFSETFKISKL